jgi:hypothetical protein
MARLRELLPALEDKMPSHDPWPGIVSRLKTRQGPVIVRRVLRPALAAATLAAVAAVVVTLVSGPQHRSMPGVNDAEALVRDSEIGMVWSDPWAGAAAQALDWVMIDRPSMAFD